MCTQFITYFPVSLNGLDIIPTTRAVAEDQFHVVRNCLAVATTSFLDGYQHGPTPLKHRSDGTLPMISSSSYRLSVAPHGYFPPPVRFCVAPKL
jgi:hypothetical protein